MTFVDGIALNRLNAKRIEAPKSQGGLYANTRVAVRRAWAAPAPSPARWPAANDQGVLPAVEYGHLTAEDQKRFWDDGFLIKRRCFDGEEVDFVRRALVEDATLRGNIIDRHEAFGTPEMEWEASDGIVQIMWRRAGEDLFGAISRCTRLVEGAERLLGGEVYNYHHAINMKPPGGGGSFRWHQDYGYWYENGILFPDMLNTIIAIDPMRRNNGCIQHLRGSHRLGRLTHLTVNGQNCADPERVKWAKERCEADYTEMEPGDVLFQHCNTLHCSEPNTSDSPRTALLGGYNLARNNPFRAHHHNSYTPLEKLPDSAVKARGRILNGAEREYLSAEILEN